MAYQKTEWKNDGVPAMSADNLNKMEDGIESAHINLEHVANSINQLPFMVSDTYTTETTNVDLTGAIDDVSAAEDEYGYNSIVFTTEVPYNFFGQYPSSGNATIAVSATLSGTIVMSNAAEAGAAFTLGVGLLYASGQTLAKTVYGGECKVTTTNTNIQRIERTGDFTFHLSSSALNLLSMQQENVTVQIVARLRGVDAYDTIRTCTDIQAGVTSISVAKPNRYTLTL